MLGHAAAAVAELPERSSWRPSALLAQGSALVLLGKYGRADAILDSATKCSIANGSTETEVIALGERALLAAELGEHTLTDELSKQLQRLVTTSDIESHLAGAVAHATTARMLLRHGRWNEARTALTAARDLTPSLTSAIPWLAVQVRLELIRGFITLRDISAAQQLLDEADELLACVPDLDTLAQRAHELQRDIDVMPTPNGRHHAGMTRAELRLLPLLATHLCFREIADQLFLSRNTIKTQAISIYRKLGASNRSEAIAEAQRLGLGE